MLLVTVSVPGLGPHDGPSHLPVAAAETLASEAVVVNTRQAASSSRVLLFTGDMLVHDAVAASARRSAGGDGFDFSAMLADVTEVIRSADLALCHLEVPLDPQSSRLRGWPRFSAPAEVAAAIATAGYDGCSTASNHSLDRGLSGISETLDVLDDAGLGHAGTARSPVEAGGEIYDVGGLIVGHIAYSYGFSGAGLLRDQPWAANVIDADRIISDAARLRRSGTDFVVVSLHWGYEYSRRPSPRQQQLAEVLLTSPDIGLVVGHHPHVLQPVAEVAGKPVAFSLGNFLSNQLADCCTARSEEGAVLLVRVEEEEGEWRVAGMAQIPTWVDRRHGHIITAALGQAAAGSRYRSRLQRAAVRTAETLGLEGLSVSDGCRWILGLAPATAQPVDWHWLIE